MNSAAFEPGPLADVDAEAADPGWTLVFVRDLNHPREKVWTALTEPDQLRRWAPFVSDRDLGTPGTATLTMLDGPDDLELPVAMVNVARRPSLLEYTWGADLLRWELTGIEGGTRLTLRHTMSDRASLAKMAAGWHLCLAVADRLLDGRPIERITGEAALGYGFEDLRQGYAKRLD